MKNKETYSMLFDYCRWNQPKNLKDILDKSVEVIDITLYDGELFHIAASEKSIELLNILLNYYEKTKLYGESYTTEYLYNRTKLQDILEDIRDTFFVSPEIEQIIDKYIVLKADSDDENTNLEDANTSETTESNESSPSPENPNLLGTESEINFDSLSQH